MINELWKTKLQVRKDTSTYYNGKQLYWLAITTESI